MNKEILAVIETVSNEKGVSRDIIVEALEAALASATKKRYREDVDIRVNIDRKSGNYETYRRWLIVDHSEMEEAEFISSRHMIIEKAHEYDKDLGVDDYVEESIESVEFGRIAAQTAKQVIVQKVREAERAKVVEAYIGKVGKLVRGIVKRMDKGNVILDLGSSAEAIILREELIPREVIRPGDRIRGHLREVRSEVRGPQLFVSRVSPELMVELFTIEVPEISEGIIEIVGCARDPGSRAKLGVRSKVPRVDPVGACVGMRGARVQAVSNDLAGERVDIITWDENPAQYVINAMQPAEVISIVVDEETHTMDVAVNESQLSQAIGRNGQNVKLASQLTGWVLNVMTEEQANEKNQAEIDRIVGLFTTELDVDDDLAAILIQEGFSSVEEVAYVNEAEMLEIEEFDEDIVKELQSRARDSLLAKEISSEHKEEVADTAKDLMSISGMDSVLAKRLQENGIANSEDLAELAIDDLLEIMDIDRDRAGRLIMSARESWFEETS